MRLIRCFSFGKVSNSRILKQNTKINKLSTGGMNSSMEKSQYHATTHIHTYSRLIQGAE